LLTDKYSKSQNEAELQNKMNSETISVIDVAKSLGKHKARIFKVLGRLNIETIKEKNSAARGQKIAYITMDDYDRVKEYLTKTNTFPNLRRLNPI
jgi:hypothetical protein